MCSWHSSQDTPKHLCIPDKNHSAALLLQRPGCSPSAGPCSTQEKWCHFSPLLCSQALLSEDPQWHRLPSSKASLGSIYQDLVFSGSDTLSPMQDLFPVLSCYILGTLILSAGRLSHLLSTRIFSLLMFWEGSFFLGLSFRLIWRTVRKSGCMLTPRTNSEVSPEH